MPNSVVVTSAKTGPGRDVAGITLNNVSEISMSLNNKRMSVTTEGSPGGNVKEFDLNAVTALTFAITGTSPNKDITLTIVSA